MKKKLLVALAVIITSGVVFAAAKTTFYTILDMTNHKIVNVADPTSNSDAATKAYADTKLPLSAGSSFPLTGDLYMGSHRIKGLVYPIDDYDAVHKAYLQANYAPKNASFSFGATIGMSGHRIQQLGAPTNPSDAANKAYVDNVKTFASTNLSTVAKAYVDDKIAESEKIQYFALSYGGGYPPIIDLSSSTSRYVNIKIIRQFSGPITVSCEGGGIRASKTIGGISPTIGSNTWRVGSTVKVALNIDQNTVATNNTLFVRGGEGRVGNWGITFPPTTTPVYKMMICAGDTPYYNTGFVDANTSVNISDYINANPGYIKIGVTNINSVAATDVLIGGGPAPTYYNNNTQYSYNIGGSPGAIVNIPAGGCVWINAQVYNYTPGQNGLRWTIPISVNYQNIYSFGQFFVPYDE